MEETKAFPQTAQREGHYEAALRSEGRGERNPVAPRASTRLRALPRPGCSPASALQRPPGRKRFCRNPTTRRTASRPGEGRRDGHDRDGGGTLTVGFCSRCPRARGAAARPTGRCCAPCLRVPRRSVWTPCTSPNSAAPSAKTVGETPAGVGCAFARLPAPHCPRTSLLPLHSGRRACGCISVSA